MKRKNIFIILGSVLTLSVVLLLSIMATLSNDDEYEVVTINCDRVSYESLSEIEERADVIVEAIIGEDQGQEVSSHYDYDIKKELPNGGYTKKSITITNVYKGDIEVDDILLFLHDYYKWTYEDGTKQLITTSAFSPVKEGDKYLLFLHKESNKEGYSSVGDYLGIYPLTEIIHFAKDQKTTDFSYIYDLYKADNMDKIIALYDEVVRKYYI